TCRRARFVRVPLPVERRRSHSWRGNEQANAGCCGWRRERGAHDSLGQPVPVAMTRRRNALVMLDGRIELPYTGSRCGATVRLGSQASSGGDLPMRVLALIAVSVAVPLISGSTYDRWPSADQVSGTVYDSLFQRPL